MKEGLNIAYLNGAKGYKKIAVQSGEGGGSTGGDSTGGGNEGNWIFIRPKETDETGAIIVANMASIIAMPFWSENSTISVIQTVNNGALCCNPAYASQIIDLMSSALYSGAIKKGAKLVIQEANIDLTVNNFDDLVEIGIMLFSLTKEEILNSVEECSAEEFMEMIAMP